MQPTSQDFIPTIIYGDADFEFHKVGSTVAIGTFLDGAIFGIKKIEIQENYVTTKGFQGFTRVTYDNNMISLQSVNITGFSYNMYNFSL